MSVAPGQIYFGDLCHKWVSFQSALTEGQKTSHLTHPLVA